MRRSARSESSRRRHAAIWVLSFLTIASILGCGAEQGGGVGGGAGNSGQDPGELLTDAIYDPRWEQPQEMAQLVGPVSHAMTCTLGSQCPTGFCVDGFCCDNGCANKCMACSAAKKGGGLDGICGSVAANTDPDNDCPAGECDGKNMCKNYNGVACTAASQCLSKYCVDGFCCGNICMGSCQACSAAKKGAGVDGACGNIKVGTDPDNECNPGECNGSGACNASPQPTYPNGTACTSASQCASGYCADGVCCNSWCLGTCQACSAAKKKQGADGVCGNIAYDQDPDEECWGGGCNGSGMCKQYNGVPCSDKSQCLSNYCVDGFCCGNICTSACYACSEAKKGQGYDGVCGPIAAGKDIDNECNPGECNGAGVCNQPQMASLANGAACSVGTQCISGKCVDGVCCDTACAETCKACSAAKKGTGADGVCGMIASTKNPDGECSGGYCNGAGACVYFNGAACSASSQCISTYCVDGNCCGNICNGPCMACTIAKRGGGFNGQCGPVANGTDPDNECALTCNGSGSCNKAPNGSACSSAADCTSGFCVDGYCCNSACTGACEFCGVGGSEGVCSNACPGPCTTTLALPNAPLPANIAMPNSITSVDAADFNADGKQDLVVVREGSGASVLLGQGNGTFAAPINIATVGVAEAVAIADLNGDTKPDIVVASIGPGGVSVILNQGNGTFASNVDYATDVSGYVAYDSQPDMLAIADFSGDGVLDLATANNAGNTVSLLLGQGNGTFGAAIGFSTPTTPTALASGDFNVDGKVDLVVTTYNSPTSTYRATVLMSQGGGAFAPAVHYALGDGKVRSLVAADLNGDNRLDLAGSRYKSMVGYKVDVLLNQGNGTFANVVSYDGKGAGQIIATNVNGDAHPDLAVASEGSTVQVLLGKGNGIFAAGVDYLVRQPANAVVAVDVDNDNDKDLVTGNRNSLAVLTNSGTGSFGRALDSDPKLAMDTNRLLSLDINTDGKLDLIGVDANGVEIALGQGNGTFGTPTESLHTVSSYTQDAKFADLNGDGKQDLILTTFDKMRIRLNQGNGIFGPETEYATYGNPGNVQVGDFNNDGTLDVATSGVRVSLINASQQIYAYSIVLSLWYGNGNGAMSGRQDKGVSGYSEYGAGYGYTCSLAAGDINGDGQIDFAINGKDFWSVGVMVNQGSGQYSFVNNTSLYNMGDLLFADLNGDGKADLLGIGGSGAVRVWLNNAGTLVFVGDYGTNILGFNPLAVDMNGDGAKDVVFGAGWGHHATVLLNQGNGSFGNNLDYPTGLYPEGITAGDWNSDGRMDLAVANQRGVSVLRGGCLP